MVIVKKEPSAGVVNLVKRVFNSITDKAREPDVKEQIDTLILNSSGVRDSARILGINKNTVISHLKKTTQVNPYLLDKEEVKNLNSLEISFHYTAEADEFLVLCG